jgi:hypothetical protein
VVLELFDLPALQPTIDAHRGQRGERTGSPPLTQHHAGSTLTKSELEERFLALCETDGLERPRVNQTVDAVLAAAGDRVLRFSYGQVASGPESVVEALKSSA